MAQFTLKREKAISKASVIIIFLALIRTISEPFRLQYYSSSELSLEEIKPFLIGALMCSVGLLIMTILLFYSKHKIIIALAVLIIIGMLMVKNIYSL
jgi:hypothetical protein